ncbi:MAG: glycoside hydrolase family 9 protein [Streptosporangiaceae bacterium]
MTHVPPGPARRPRRWFAAVPAAAVLAAAALTSVAAARPASAAPGGAGSAAGPAAARAICREPAPGAHLATGARAAATAPAPAAVIRADQVGYPAGARKLAEIMTTTRRPHGVRWVLVRAGSCTAVAAGTARRDLGAWSRRYSRVWAVTFTGVRRPGRYRLGLAGDPAVVSPWFEIGPAPQLYARPLANARYFYQNEQDGPDFVRTALRTAPGHLNDLHAMTYRTPPVNENGNFRGSLARYATGVRINASGGWFDAGDYLHFVETTSYAEALLLQGVVSFPRQLGPGATASLAGEARFGMDFLRRMWHQRTRTLYYQVGTGEANSHYFGDHDIWRLPQADDHYRGANPRYRYIRHPPVFRAGPPGARISPNLAGRLAADFALCYRVFRRSDPGYAAGCLRSAETVYSLAATRWHGQLMTTVPYDFYPETSWRDDMMLGAIELALALADSRGARPAGLPVRSSRVYLRAAARWARAWAGGRSAVSDTLNLYDVSGLADYELYLAIGPHRGGWLGATRAVVLRNLRGQLDRAERIGAGDPFGFGFAWNQWDTTTHGAGLSVLANEYDAATRSTVFAAQAQRWLDDILGASAWGVSLIVGDGTVFPECMQHQVANLVGSHDGRPPVLAGAAVEGPNSFAATGTVPNMRPCVANAPGNVPYSAFSGHGALFADNVQSYSTVEPAIDLTAPTPLAFAWQESAARGLVPRP